MIPIEAAIRKTRWRSRAIILWLAIVVDFSGSGPGSLIRGAEPDEPWLAPYTGPTRSDVSATTLDGKVLCGYQGWFNTPGDGTNFGFAHWGSRLTDLQDRHFTIDMWPDTSEYTPRDLARFRVSRCPTVRRPGFIVRFARGPFCFIASGCGNTASTAFF